MLYTTKGLTREQLLSDLLAVRQLLQDAWCKGGFIAGQNVCIVAACDQVAGAPEYTFKTVLQDSDSETEKRFGYMIAAIYQTLYGKNANSGVTLRAAQGSIALFNDGPATHEAVLLLLDRAIERVLQPSEVPA